MEKTTWTVKRLTRVGTALVWKEKQTFTNGEEAEEWIRCQVRGGANNEDFLIKRNG